MDLWSPDLDKVFLYRNKTLIGVFLIQELLINTVSKPSQGATVMAVEHSMVLEAVEIGGQFRSAIVLVRLSEGCITITAM
jgi:hypothetical protein